MMVRHFFFSPSVFSARWSYICGQICTIPSWSSQVPFSSGYFAPESYSKEHTDWHFRRVFNGSTCGYSTSGSSWGWVHMDLDFTRVPNGSGGLSYNKYPGFSHYSFNCYFVSLRVKKGGQERMWGIMAWYCGLMGLSWRSTEICNGP